MNEPPDKHCKDALRQHVRIALKSLTPSEQTSLSAQACARLQATQAWQSAKAVLCYAPLRGELDVWPLVLGALDEGKVVCLPRFDAVENRYVACEVVDVARDLCLGKYGIREPALHCSVRKLNHLDFVLVPGVAFDLAGHRLGRGKGYYDKLLAAYGRTTCGAAFDQQIVDRIPSEPHDVRLSCILTPTRWQPVTDQRAVL